MHCSLLVSLCVSLSVILISSVTGIGTLTTDLPTTDLSSSEITKDPIPQYTILHAPSDLLDALEKIPNPNSYGRPLKQYSIHNAHNGVRRHRRHTVSQMTTAAAPTPTVLPIPGGGYVPFFQNQDGAISAADYMTYRIVKTIAECKAFCDSISGCIFANSYHDVYGKNDNPDLTCSLYTMCHTAAEATNRGGQTQPDGRLNYITNSDGWCKALDRA